MRVVLTSIVLVLLLVAGVALADGATSGAPADEVAKPLLFEPSRHPRLALVPLPSDIKPQKGGDDLELMRLTLVRPVKGKKHLWLSPSRLRGKLAATAQAIGVSPESAGAMLVMVPCNFGDRIWIPERERKGKRKGNTRSTTLPSRLDACLRRALNPYAKELAKGLVVSFDKDPDAAKKRLAKEGYGGKLYPAMIVGRVGDVGDLGKKLEGKTGLLMASKGTTSAGTASSPAVLISPRPPRQKRGTKRRGG